MADNEFMSNFTITVETHSANYDSQAITSALMEMEIVSPFLDVANGTLRNETSGDLFHASSSIFKGFYYSTLTVITVLGLIGNILILFLIGHETLRRLSYGVYLRCLAVVDSMVLLHVLTEDFIDYKWSVDDFLGSSVHFCRFWTWMTLCTRQISPWLVVALTVERFIAVAFPFKRQKLCTFKTAIVVSCTIIVINVIQTLMTTIPYLEIEYIEDHSTTQPVCELRPDSEWIGRLNQVNMIFVMTCLPCLLILVFNVFIIIKLNSAHRSRQRLKGNNWKSDSNSKTGPSPDKTVASLVAVSITAFVTLSPKAIFEATEYFEKTEMNLKAWQMLNCIEMLNFSQNFYVLMITGRNYKVILKEKLSNLFNRSLPGK